MSVLWEQFLNLNIELSIYFRLVDMKISVGSTCQFFEYDYRAFCLFQTGCYEDFSDINTSVLWEQFLNLTIELSVYFRLVVMKISVGSTCQFDGSSS